MTLSDGTELSPALGIGAFAEKTLVHAGQCTKVDPAVKPEVAGLLGCGVMAGLGAAINTGGVGRGDSVAVIGCGGVGGAAIAGSRLAGAAKIIAVDVDDRKLATARELGATHTVNSKSQDPVKAIQDLTDGFGADVVVDAVGRPETYEQAFYARDLAGTVVLVGVPTPDMKLELPLLDYFGRGGALKSSWYGDCLPSRDFPMLVDLHLQGRLPLDKFVSETISLDQVEDAFAAMDRGDVLRSVVAVLNLITGVTRSSYVTMDTHHLGKPTDRWGRRRRRVEEVCDVCCTRQWHDRRCAEHHGSGVHALLPIRACSARGVGAGRRARLTGPTRVDGPTRRTVAPAR